MSLDINNGGHSLPSNLTKHFIKKGIEKNVPPSLFICQTYYESNWGSSQVAKDNNNWGGSTWNGNPTRPSGIIVTKGTLRPASEKGNYMKFLSVEDYLTDYVYLLTDQGIYNIQNQPSFELSVKGLFKAGGATYNYAIVSWQEYQNTMLGVRVGINKRNYNILDKIDNDPKSFVEGEEPIEPPPLPPDPDNDDRYEDIEPNYDFTVLDKFFDGFSEKISELLNDVLTIDFYDYGNSKTFGNNFLTVTKVLNGSYKLQPTINLSNSINEILKKGSSDLNNTIDGMTPISPDGNEEPEPPEIEPEPSPEPPPETSKNKPLYPCPSHLYISSKYGPRWGTWHDGIDIGHGGGDPPIYATQNGKVVKNFWHDNTGWTVQIQHTDDPYFSGYQHLAVRSPCKVGDIVEKGHTVGIMGLTGKVTGKHLHFNIAKHIKGFWTRDGTIDPEEYLKMEF